MARLMDGERAQCMWTDPPYGVGYVGKTRRALTIENDDAGGPGVFAGACAIAPLAPSAPFYVTVPAGPRQLDFLLAVRDVGWRLHQELVWVKNSIVLGPLRLPLRPRADPVWLHARSRTTRSGSP